MLVKSTARLKYVSIPPRKMRLVAKMVNGMPVEKALNILNFTPRIAAHHLAKTVKSAAANALSTEGTDHLKPEDLMVENIIVDAAPTAKRIRFQSMGRVFRYRKRFCHLTVNVSGEMDLETPATPVKAKAKSTKATKADSSAVATGEETKKKVSKKRTPIKESKKDKIGSIKGSRSIKTTSTVKKTHTKKDTKGN